MENDTPRVDSPPQCMVLYHELELEDWKASEETIKNAFQSIAVRVHPDKVSGDEEVAAAANQKMQRVLAARNVLLDDVQRRKYHEDGVLPATWPFDGIL